MVRACAALAGAGLALALTGALGRAEQASSPAAHERELRQLREDIAGIDAELTALRGREEGLAGELRRLDAELRLRQSEHDELALRRAGIDAEIARRDDRIGELEAEQERRRSYLAFRLREMYKTGPLEPLRRLLEGSAPESYWDGVRYASLLSQRDSERIVAYRRDSEQIGSERGELGRARSELEVVEAEVLAARAALAAARRRHAAALETVRADQRQRQTARAELEVAAAALERVVGGLATAASLDPLDMRKFRGLLDWPADGELRAGFGTFVHPQFQTEVPHPGWDLAAEVGADIRCVFDGTVMFADWMRGYGLTVIVDHGGELMTIYAHASALTVQAGQRVRRGERLGQVGETASLRGPVLYFELRDGGSAVDPREWLRPG